jgi:hypothetical protein
MVVYLEKALRIYLQSRIYNLFTLIDSNHLNTYFLDPVNTNYAIGKQTVSDSHDIDAQK